MKGIIPGKDIEFDAFLNRYCGIVTVNTSGTPPAWDHIPAARVTELTAARDGWSAAYAKLGGAHISADVLTKNEARRNAEEVLRAFDKEFILYSSKVTNAEREELGHKPHKSKAPVPSPTTTPLIEVEAGAIRRIVLAYREAGKARHGKPENVHGIEVQWDILDAPPTRVEDLRKSIFDTRSPLVLEFEENQRGKRVYFSGRWEIQREGIKGPFGPILDAIIP